CGPGSSVNLGQPRRLWFVERDRRLGAAAFVPDAEANVAFWLGAAEVARNAEGLALVALELAVRPEELDELPPLRRGAPGAIVEPRRHGSAALRAGAHSRLLSHGGYNGAAASGSGVSRCQARGDTPWRYAFEICGPAMSPS